MTDLGQEYSEMTGDTGGAVDIGDIMQKMAEHKGCGYQAFHGLSPV